MMRRRTSSNETSKSATIPGTATIASSVSPCRNTSAAEAVQERVHDRPHGDDEQRRQDQKHEREDDLGRCLLRAFLSGLAATLAHVDCKVSQNLPDRNAKGVSLQDCLDEHAQRGAVRSCEHVLERVL